MTTIAHVCHADATPVRTVRRTDLPHLTRPDEAWLDPYGETIVPVEPPKGRWGEFHLIPHGPDARLVTVQRLGAHIVIRAWGTRRQAGLVSAPVPLVTTRPWPGWHGRIFREIEPAR